MRFWVILYRFAWGVLLVLFATGMVFLFLPKCRELQALQRKRAGLQDQSQRTRAATAELRHKQERFATDPSFVERTARESGLVRPDEVLFKFEPSPRDEE